MANCPVCNSDIPNSPGTCPNCKTILIRCAECATLIPFDSITCPTCEEIKANEIKQQEKKQIQDANVTQQTQEFSQQQFLATGKITHIPDTKCEIAEKLRTLATAYVWICIIGAFLAFFIIGALSSYLLGLLYSIGCIALSVNALFIVGFAQLIDDVHAIKNITK